MDKPFNFKLLLEGVGEIQPDGSMRIVGVLSQTSAPSAPTGLRVVQFSNAFVELAWDRAALEVSFWSVYRSEDEESYSELGETVDPAFVDSTVAADTGYYYKIFANNAAGTSQSSGVVTVHTAAQGVPSAPTGLAVVDIGAGFVTLEWAVVTDASEWDVYRDAVLLATVSDRFYTDSTVQPSTTYSFTVIARNDVGNSAASAAFPVVVPDNAVPAWSLTDQAGNDGDFFSLDLRTVCTDSDGHPISFSVFSGALPDGLALSGTNITGTFSLAGSFTCVLRADDGFDTSDVEIDWAVAAIDTTPPPDPTNVVATAVGSTVTVTWDLVDDPSGVPIYRVRRDGSFIQNVSAPPYVQSGVADGTYTYSVRAEDGAGNVSNVVAAAAVVVATAPAAPDAPISFTAVTISSSRIDLSWAPGPNGAAPTDYELDFSTAGSSGPWTSIPVGLVTTFQHTGLTTSQQYWYRLRALNGAIAGAYATASGITLSGTPVPWPAFSFPSSANSTSSVALQFVPRFHACSILWDEPSGSVTNEAMVRFREVSTGPSGPWRQGLSLIWDPRVYAINEPHLSPPNDVPIPGAVPFGNEQYRGCIVDLQPNTAYEVEVMTQASGNRRIRTGTFTTWMDTADFPIESTVTRPESSASTFTITAGGSAGLGYRVYDREGGWTVAGNNAINNGVVVDAPYVILRNFTVRDVLNHCVQLTVNAHHVVLELFDLSNMGHSDPQAPQYGCNNSAGIMIGGNSGLSTGITHVVVQRGRIHHPRFDANAWDEFRPPGTNSNGSPCGPAGDGYHPANTTAIYMKDLGGQIVIRYNQIDSDLTHMFDDCIGGAQNFSFRGGIGPHSDMYGNRSTYCTDDNLEAEGGGMCVCIWGNYTSLCRVHHASGCCSMGPKYIWDNVAERGLLNPDTSSSNEGWLLKLRSKPNDVADPSETYLGQGHLFMMHQTVYRTGTANATKVPFQLDLGAVPNLHVWNCILDTSQGLSSTYRGWVNDAGNDADFRDNLYGSAHTKPTIDTTGQVATAGTITYESGHASGPYTPSASSPAVGTGTFIPNFRDKYGTTPDRGAQQRGGPALVFGIQ